MTGATCLGLLLAYMVLTFSVPLVGDGATRSRHSSAATDASTPASPDAADVRRAGPVAPGTAEQPAPDPALGPPPAGDVAAFGVGAWQPVTVFVRVDVVTARVTDGELGVLVAVANDGSRAVVAEELLAVSLERTAGGRTTCRPRRPLATEPGPPATTVPPGQVATAEFRCRGEASSYALVRILAYVDGGGRLASFAGPVDRPTPVREPTNSSATQRPSPVGT